MMFGLNIALSHDQRFPSLPTHSVFAGAGTDFCGGGDGVVFSDGSEQFITATQGDIIILQ
jgi:hypothetical protein